MVANENVRFDTSAATMENPAKDEGNAEIACCGSTALNGSDILQAVSQMDPGAVEAHKPTFVLASKLKYPNSPLH